MDVGVYDLTQDRMSADGGLGLMAKDMVYGFKNIHDFLMGRKDDLDDRVPPHYKKCEDGDDHGEIDSVGHPDYNLSENWDPPPSPRPWYPPENCDAPPPPRSWLPPQNSSNPTPQQWHGNNDPYNCWDCQRAGFDFRHDWKFCKDLRRARGELWH